ncbi:MAG: LysM peptidoglycan-binding domain-containing protein [Anaerolineae bacterium]
MKRIWQIWLISGLLVTLIVSAFPVAPVAAQDSSATVYVVQAGDTLSSIARRYGVTAADLASANGLLNPNLIYVGQRLRIPTAATITTPKPTAAPTTSPAKTSNPPATNRIHVVQSGETLFRIATQYGTSVQAIANANTLSNIALIYVGQQLIIPADAAAAVAQPSTPLRAPFTSVEIGPLPLQQGSVMVVTVRTDRAVKLTGAFQDWNIPFAPDGDKYIGLVGVSASPTTGVVPGIYPVSITATDDKGQQVTVTANVQINAGHFNSEYIDLPPDRQALLDPVLVKTERDKLNAVWTIFNPTRYWSGAFSTPAASYLKISSPFGTRRAYAGGPFSDYHEGTDFAMGAGTPVYAPADGVVVLAEPLTVRGNAIVIDHGWGVYTGYYHLSKIEVTVGQTVKPGDEIALSGNTGLSTGAHLHWDMRIRGLNVDPLQFTRRAFP